MAVQSTRTQLNGNFKTFIIPITKINNGEIEEPQWSYVAYSGKVCTISMAVKTILTRDVETYEILSISSLAPMRTTILAVEVLNGDSTPSIIINEYGKILVTSTKAGQSLLITGTWFIG